MRPIGSILMLETLAFSVALALAGCASSHDSDSGSSGGPTAAVTQSLSQELGMSVRFGSSVTAEQANRFLNAFSLISKFETPSGADAEGEAGEKSFSRFFGTPAFSSLGRYCRDRIHLIYPISGQEPAPLPRFLLFNPSALLWFSAEATRSPTTPVTADGVAFLPESTRAGVIRFNPPVLSRAPAVALLIELAREARHSDCPHGIDREKIRDAEKMNFKEASRVFEGESCGEFHVACPESHPDGPILNCDAHFWGAHTAGYLVARALAGRCRDCPIETRYMAALYAMDAAGRILAVPLEDRQMIWAWLRWVDLYGDSSDIYWQLNGFEDVFQGVDRMLERASGPELVNRDLVH